MSLWPESRDARLALGWIGAITLFRLWFAPHLDLVGDEAHYWECGRELDWNHYGKGPGAAFVIWVFTTLLGDHVWALRLPAVLLSAGTGWMIFVLGRKLYSERVGLVAVVAASAMPLFAIGSILMTIDPLSVFFWVAAALSFWSGVQTEKKRWWVKVGSVFLAEILRCQFVFGGVGGSLSGEAVGQEFPSEELNHLHLGF